MMEYNAMLDINEKEIMFMSSVVIVQSHEMNRIRVVYLYVGVVGGGGGPNACTVCAGLAPA